MTRHAVGEALALRLHAAEAAVDAALVAASALAGALPAARCAALLSAMTGQRAFEGAAGAVSALVEARAQLVRTHASLTAVARALGLDDLAVGPVDKPEDDPPLGGGRLTSRKPVEFAPESC
ncbi:MAG: hypothetical protein KJ676_11165 [Alphaproteobacteria bacterium]|nr:hypothetical protein [Alphaproteobacteria bacterium]MBU1525557.1 hypothetical protein [Alphaproteobacteria bacterium]MBU2116961.1 hypothetical protein [Alphaproteobacteria bacterium]MBU2350492.1 hypothetical protein [Alphaproteobacteria bacterium]MBU2381515.1 hypothetical protein [Alphaproteobacteria bacterium]